MPVGRRVQAFALFELLKGSMALVVPVYFYGFGLPVTGLPSFLLRVFAHLPSSSTELLSIVCVAYALLRFVEFYSLWTGASWGYNYAAFSVAFFIPLELYELLRRPDGLKFLMLTLNFLVLWFFLRAPRPEREDHERMT